MGCQYHHEWPLRPDQDRAGWHALIDETLASLICQTPISQHLTYLHEPVAIPAIQPVAPGLTGRVKTYLTCMQMMRAAILLFIPAIGLFFLRSTVCLTRVLALHLLPWCWRL